MELGKTLYVTNRKQWRSWLAKNHAREKVIWLIFYKKSSGKPRIPYNDAVEEALCYGWIDGTVKAVDEAKFAQRFTPRRPKSMLSEMNKERIRRLIANKSMTSAGLSAVSHAFDKNQKFKIAPDILKAIKADKQAWKHFQNFPQGYKMVRIGYIEHSRTRDNKIFETRLNYFIKMAAKNKKFGMVQ